jgi:hypothetical protein
MTGLLLGEPVFSFNTIANRDYFNATLALKLVPSLKLLHVKRSAEALRRNVRKVDALID